MITAIVLIKTSVDRIPEIAESIAALDSVSEVFSVTGTYDLIAMVRVKAHDDLADVIPGKISKIPGVEGRTPTSRSARTPSTTWRRRSPSASTARHSRAVPSGMWGRSPHAPPSRSQTAGTQRPSSVR